MITLSGTRDVCDRDGSRCQSGWHAGSAGEFGILDLQWHVAPETMLFVGYQYQQVNYTGNEPIAFSPELAFYTKNLANIYYYSSARDNRSHYGYIGLQHTFLENLNFNGRAGVQYVEELQRSVKFGVGQSICELVLFTPICPAATRSSGFNHGQNATDVVAVQLTQGQNQFGRLTQAQESSSFYYSHQSSHHPQAAGDGHCQLPIF